MIAVIPRSEIGMRPRRGTPKPMEAVAGLIVHCTAGNQPTSPQDSETRWLNVQAYHMDHKGWADIGYSFGFDDFGQILEGRGWGVHGAHAGPEWNRRYHGVCYLGSGESPTWKALCALREFIREHDRCYGGDLEILGHRDIASRTCPGQGVYEYLATHFPTRNPYLVGA